VQRFRTCLRYWHIYVWKPRRLDKVRWRQYRRWSLYIRLLWRISGTRKKKSSWCTMSTTHNSQGRSCDKATDSSTEPSPRKCVESELYKSLTQKTRSCTQLCEDMWSDHISLLCYCSSRWLSRGNGLSHMLALR
jgi:hypothetical protein